MKYWLISAVLILLAGYPTSAQKKKPTQRDSTHALPPSAVMPALPVEVKVGYHRLSEPAIFLTLTNRDTHRTVTKAICTILAMDRIKLELVNRYYSVNFKFAIPIEPGKSGESVVTKSDDASIYGPAFTPAACRDYEPSKDNPTYFIPNECKASDMLSVILVRVIYSDGSEWVSRSATLPRS